MKNRYNFGAVLSAVVLVCLWSTDSESEGKCGR